MNKNGWGLREMIIFSAIILFFVILVAVLISNLYSQLSPSNIETESKVESDYGQVEKNLKNAAERYYKKNKTELGNIILSEVLVEEGYLKTAKLQVQEDTCEGYVIIDESFLPFITCSNYETEGY